MWLPLGALGLDARSCHEFGELGDVYAVQRAHHVPRPADPSSRLSWPYRALTPAKIASAATAMRISTVRSFRRHSASVLERRSQRAVWERV